MYLLIIIFKKSEFMAAQRIMLFRSLAQYCLTSDSYIVYIYIANLNLHDRREARSLRSLANYRHYNYPACVCVCVCVCVSVRSFLPLRASISRNIGTYVFTATRKTLYIGIIIVINFR